MLGKILGVSGISMHMHIYIGILSLISMWYTMDSETDVSYAGLNDDSNEHDSSQIDWLSKNSKTVKWCSTVSCTLYLNTNIFKTATAW